MASFANDPIEPSAPPAAGRDHRILYTLVCLGAFFAAACYWGKRLHLF